MNAHSSVISSVVEKSILQTLKYSDHFGFPLTIDEIHTRLIGVPIRRIGLIRQISLMLKNGLIAHTGNYYHLPGRKSLISRRLHRAKISQPLLTRASRLATQLSAVPGVLAVYLTGSLAMQNPRGDVDIDFMLIIQPGRLWTTRLLLTLYAEFFGLRRHPGYTHNYGKLCLNIYLTPTTYHLPSTKQSLYTAYELIQAVPLFDPEDTHSALLATNAWIHTYLPNFVFPIPVPQRSDLVGCKPNQKPTRLDLAGLIEKLCYHVQKIYMAKKLTREYVTPDSAFFHPHDPGAAVLKKIRP